MRFNSVSMLIHAKIINVQDIIGVNSHIFRLETIASFYGARARAYRFPLIDTLLKSAIPCETHIRECNLTLYNHCMLVLSSERFENKMKRNQIASLKE